MKQSKKYLKKCALKNIDQAEDLNHHSIVALDYAESNLEHSDERVRWAAIALYNVALDLCVNDYDKNQKCFSDTSRQYLIQKRSELSCKLFELKKTN